MLRNLSAPHLGQRIRTIVPSGFTSYWACGSALPLVPVGPVAVNDTLRAERLPPGLVPAYVSSTWVVVGRAAATEALLNKPAAEPVKGDVLESPYTNSTQSKGN